MAWVMCPFRFPYEIVTFSGLSISISWMDGQRGCMCVCVCMRVAISVVSCKFSIYEY